VCGLFFVSRVKQLRDIQGGFCGYLLVRTQLKKRKKKIADEQHKADFGSESSQIFDERSLDNGTINLNDAVSVFELCLMPLALAFKNGENAFKAIKLARLQNNERHVNISYKICRCGIN
jgi:hypothetical protein